MQKELSFIRLLLLQRMQFMWNFSFGQDYSFSSYYSFILDKYMGFTNKFNLSNKLVLKFLVELEEWCKGYNVEGNSI